MALSSKGPEDACSYCECLSLDLYLVRVSVWDGCSFNDSPIYQSAGDIRRRHGLWLCYVLEKGARTYYTRKLSKDSSRGWFEAKTRMATGAASHLRTGCE